MERIAAIVDGHAERHFFSIAANAHVQDAIGNGISVPIDHIVEDAILAMRALSFDIKTVVVIFDREGRSETVQELASAVADRLAPHSSGRNLAVGVKDRHLENWILADPETVCSKLGLQDYTYSHEGLRGKPVLSQMVGYRLSYVDTATLLKSCFASRIASNSPSFAHFLGQLSCAWFWIER